MLLLNGSYNSPNSLQNNNKNDNKIYKKKKIYCYVLYKPYIGIFITFMHKFWAKAEISRDWMKIVCISSSLRT
jgi:hypothetical protein